MVELVLINTERDEEIYRERIPPGETDLTPEVDDIVTLSGEFNPQRVIQRRVDLDGIDEIRLLVREVTAENL